MDLSKSTITLKGCHASLVKEFGYTFWTHDIELIITLWIPCKSYARKIEHHGHYQQHFPLMDTSSHSYKIMINLESKGKELKERQEKSQRSPRVTPKQDSPFFFLLKKKNKPQISLLLPRNPLFYFKKVSLCSFVSS